MKKTICLILTVMFILMLFAGCGASKASDSAAPQEAATTAGSAKSEVYYEDIAEEERFEAAPAEAPGAAMDTTVPISKKLPESVKLIYRADIDMETTEFEAAIKSLSGLVEKAGGYFESSSLDNYSNYRCAYYTVRVPAEKFEDFCSGVGEYCQLNNISRSAEDISEIYYDTESRLNTQQTKLARLQELLAEAEDMADIITIESAISDTELAIENLTGTIRNYDSLVGFSTINICLREVYRLSGTEEPAIGFGAKLSSAFRSGCSNFVDEMQFAAIRFARNWVGWLLFFVIAAIAIVIIVRVVRRRHRKKAERIQTHDDAEK